MAGAVKGPLSKTEELQVARYIGERIQYPVGLDVWTRKESGFVRTDRDTCTHCEDVLLAMRQLATLHPALSITPYDLDRFADRAEQAGVDTVPTTILRGSGRSLRFVGLPSGLLFPAFLDLIWFVSNGVTPVGDETRAALRAIEERVDIEVMVTPYDGYSAYMARLLGAFAVESRQLRVRITEMAEFPILAGQRSLSEVPLVTIKGRRFVGVWDEAPLAEQIARVLAGNDEPVIRDRVLAAQFVTEDDARRMAEQQRAAQAEARGMAPTPGDPSMPPGPEDLPTPSLTEEDDRPPSSGLYVPGR